MLFKTWAGLALLVGVFLCLLSLMAVFDWNTRRLMGTVSRREPVRRLTQALEEGLRAADAIKTEIEEGDRVLAEMEHRTATSHDLAQLSEREAAAVHEVVRSEFSRFRRGSLWRDGLFTLFGAGLGLLLTRLFAQ